MAGLKEIRRRITSVKNTKQITRAMKLVSAAKLKRAQDAAVGGRDFSRRLGDVISTLQSELPSDFSHPLLKVADEVKTRRIVVVSGERGLCGAYNANIIKSVVLQESQPGLKVEVVGVGRRSAAALRRLKFNILDSVEGLPEDSSQWPIDAIAEGLIRDFSAGKVDEVVLYYTTFVSALTQRVTREVLLPLSNLTAEGSSEPISADSRTKLRPSAEEILAKVIPMILKMRVRQAILESKASEHAARMTAMDSATNNANDLIERLRLFYNRARQSTITRELIDIVGGAEAIK